MKYLFVLLTMVLVCGATADGGSTPAQGGSVLTNWPVLSIMIMGGLVVGMVLAMVMLFAFRRQEANQKEDARR